MWSLRAGPPMWIGPPGWGGPMDCGSGAVAPAEWGPGVIQNCPEPHGAMVCSLAVPEAQHIGLRFWRSSASGMGSWRNPELLPSRTPWRHSANGMLKNTCCARTSITYKKNSSARGMGSWRNPELLPTTVLKPMAPFC